MRILWLTPIFPYPPFSGGQTRAYNLIKGLASGGDEITLFSFKRPGKIQGPSIALKKYCRKIITFPGRAAWTVRNVLTAGFTQLPFAITHFYGDKEVATALQKELNIEKYDLVHFESFYTSPYLKYVSSVPTVMGNENIEYLIYQRFVALKKFLPLKIMLNYDVWKMKIYEQNVWHKADLNLAVSDADAKVIGRVTGKTCAVIPNGVDVNKFKKIKRPACSKKDFKLLFVGDFRYFTNQDTIEYLTKIIFPIIKNRNSQVQLRLVGKNPTSFLKRINDKSIIIDSGVEDISQAYGKADLMVAPLRIKSGTQIKLLEAMAAGLPVVTTSLGIEGIEATPGKEVIVTDKPEDFADAVADLLINPKKRQELAIAAKKLAADKYDWEKIGQKLNQVYQEFLNGK
jgi:glycosyltransferase involved in cell wall biosynthesis